MSQIEDARQSMWEARRNPLLFFGATWVFSMGVAALSGLPVSALTRWVIGLGAPALVAAIIAFTPFIERVFGRSLTWPIATIVPAKKARGLVVVASVGRGIESAADAIRYHGSSRVWCLHSDASMKDAHGLREAVIREGAMSADSFQLIHLTDADFDNPEKVKEAIDQRVFATLPSGFTESDVVIDITGGTKLSTAGAFLSGLPAGRRLEFVRALSKNRDGYAYQADKPYEIDITYKVKRVRP